MYKNIYTYIHLNTQRDTHKSIIKSCYNKQYVFVVVKLDCKTHINLPCKEWKLDRGKQNGSAKGEPLGQGPTGGPTTVPLTTPPLLLTMALAGGSRTTWAEAFDSVLGETVFCHGACVSWPSPCFVEEEEELYTCQKGHRLFSICQFVDDGIDLNHTKMECGIHRYRSIFLIW